ncbi:MAG: hypothetical protein JWM82_3182, partial [Myxococcales bacterium]|nr:hypothetical protein [Myxococcales bacterium]
SAAAPAAVAPTPPAPAHEPAPDKKEQADVPLKTTGGAVIGKPRPKRAERHPGAAAPGADLPEALGQNPY